MRCTGVILRRDRNIGSDQENPKQHSNLRADVFLTSLKIHLRGESNPGHKNVTRKLLNL